MKIIAKTKDYYDFIAGYDTDPRKVYLRTEKEVDRKADIYDLIMKYTSNHNRQGKDFVTPFFIGAVWFCDQFYTYLHIKDKFYYTYESIPEDIKGYINRANKYGDRWNSYSLEHYFRVKKKKSKYYTRFWERLNEERIGKEMNKTYGQPVVFSKLTLFGPTCVENGILKDIQFSQIKSPAIAFTELYNWIPYIEPEMPSDPTDIIRYEGKGFDKKTSFRHPTR